MTRSRRGQAMIEVALVLPVLLLLALGCVDLGRMVMTSIALEEATQEGAMYAAYNPSATDPIRARVRGSTTVTEIQTASVNVVCSTSPSPGEVQVTAAITFPLITPVVSAMLGSPVSMSATVSATNVQGTCS